MVGVLTSLADDDLDNFAVLAKVVVAAQGIEEAVFADRGGKARDINEVLLDDAEASEVLATERIGLGLLGLLLAYLGVLLRLLGDLLLMLGQSTTGQGRVGERVGSGGAGQGTHSSGEMVFHSMVDSS